MSDSISFQLAIVSSFHCRFLKRGIRLPGLLWRQDQISREEYVLDEDDNELLEDNNVFAPRRKWILSTWTDSECKLIMENCYKALPVGGKLIACEPVLPTKSDDSRRTRTLLENDIFVMRAKGKNRTEEELRQLGLSAGFSHFRPI